MLGWGEIPSEGAKRYANEQIFWGGGGWGLGVFFGNEMGGDRGKAAPSVAG